MSVPYDMFTKAFLAKVNEYDFVTMDMFDRNDLVDGYMKRAISHFRHVCKYDLSTTSDDIVREFFVDIEEDDMDEILDIVSEGMVAQWMKPYVYKQDSLEIFLNTRDFTAYSPAEMLLRIGEAYRAVNRNFTNMMREYSYNHGDLSDLHL